METVRDFDFKYKLKAVALAGLRATLRKSAPFLALSAAFAAPPTPPAPVPDALQTLRSGSYSHDATPLARATIFDWNIDRGKDLDDIEGQMRKLNPDLCIFQEVDLDARRSGGIDVAKRLAEKFRILGNAVTNVACSDAGGVSNKQYHDMYFFGNGIEVGWNKIFNVCAYNGIQINYFADSSIGFGNLSIHDNDISGANGAGINMASVDPSQGPINIYNNLIHHVGLQPASDGSSFHSCIAFPGEAPSAAPGAVNVYNNTMYDCSSYLNTVSDPSSCTVYMVYETAQKGLTVNLVNNIMAQPAYTYTSKQSVYLCGGGVNSMLGGMNNLFYSASTPGSIYDAMTVGSINNPLFVSTTAGSLNLNLTSNSPAIGAGSASLYSPLDFNGVTRPTPSAIGAFEYGSPSGEQITVSAAPNPATAEEPVTLTATVAQTGSSVPTGSIDFLNAGVSLGQASLNGEGTATLVVSSLSAGSYAVIASYSGDSNYPAGESGAVSLEVQSDTTTTLVATPNPVTAGQALTLTATVADSGGSTPAGTVSFTNGSTQLGTGTLNSSGVATLSTAALAAPARALVHCLRNECRRHLQFATLEKSPEYTLVQCHAFLA